MPPTVSVVVTCYNFEAYIAETLRTLAAQSHRDFDAVIVDNGSSDGSPEIIESSIRDDPRFRLVREERVGVHHALNAGVTHARGELVLFLDGDDLYRPERVAATVHHFGATGAHVVACNGQRIDREGRLDDLFEPYIHSATGLPALVCQYNPIWTMSFLALTRQALLTVGELPERFNRILDWHLLMSAYEDNLQVAYLDVPLVLKRYHGKNLALDREATERQAVPRLRDFLQRCDAAGGHYDAAARRRLLTVRYVRAIEDMRRDGRWEAMTTFLADHVGPDGIHEDVQRFGALLAWYHLDRPRFVRETQDLAGHHPLFLFLQGLSALERGDAPRGAQLFELAYIRTMRRFSEALNSWAVATAHFDRVRALTMLEHLVSISPDYRDARLNRSLVRNRQVQHCRHTVCLRPSTLQRFAEWR